MPIMNRFKFYQAVCTFGLTLLQASLLLAAESPASKHSYESVATVDEVVWSLEFPSASELLFTTRSGKVRSLDLTSKKQVVVIGTPQVAQVGQGGLLDLALHPDFQKNRIVYLTYSKKVKEDQYTTAVYVAEYKNAALVNGKDIFISNAVSDNSIHFGSRIAFDKNKNLFFAIGDRNEREKAQDLNAHNGKVLRITDSGATVTDNPFAKSGSPHVWSYGHRNPQGIAFDPVTQNLYVAEFGPRGGDEINLISKGNNYGWPVVSYGREYWGPKISSSPKKDGITDPVLHFVPSISPSGIEFYTGDKYPEWKNDLFVANLSGSHILRLKLKDNKVVNRQELFNDANLRFRDLKTGPDGFLYFVTDSGLIGRILR